jgi:hypothetical protein
MQTRDQTTAAIGIAEIGVWKCSRDNVPIRFHTALLPLKGRRRFGVPEYCINPLSSPFVQFCQSTSHTLALVPRVLHDPQKLLIFVFLHG